MEKLSVLEQMEVKRRAKRRRIVKSVVKISVLTTSIPILLLLSSTLIVSIIQIAIGIIEM
jgi:hypothetical protein